jgi:DNA polymerase I-like protein with 3'-5' exonuclease and polymerase domains
MIEYERVTRAEDLGAIANAILGAQVLGLDIETTDLDPYEGEIRLVQLNVGGKIYVIDLFQTKTLEPIVSALRDSKAIKVIHNVKFEQKWLKFKYDLELWPVFCTFRASALIYNGLDVGNNLWDVEQRELGIDHTGEDDQGKSNWSAPVLTEDQWNYAAKDVEHLFKLREILKKKLADNGLIQVALIEFESILPECSIEINGFYLDKERWLKVAEENRIEAKKRAEVVFAMLPHPNGQLGLPGMLPSWNLGSTQQMLASLHRLGRETNNKTLLGLADTKEMTLAVAAAHVPELRKIVDYRKVDKQYDSFGPSYLKHISKHTGRIHTSFYAMLDTGRYSSSDPNLQQIPRDPRFRACFAAEEGNELVAADYSGIEMRIVAEISGDEELINIFLTDQDPHKVTASVVMAKALEEVTKQERQLAKPVNFGLIYGMMPAKLVLYAASGYGVYMSEKEATVYHKRYFTKFDGVARWHQRVMRDGKRERCSRTLSGRIRHLDPDIAWNEFKNTPVQGTGADALKAALPLVYREIKKHGSDMKIVHIVHDEIILECRKDPEVNAAARKILHDGMKTGMEKFLKRVPVVVDPASGPNWSEVKG